MTVILIIIILIGLISIGYLIVKIVVLMKEHKAAKNMSESFLSFDMEQIRVSDKSELSEDELTVLIDQAMEENCLYAKLQFSKIADQPSVRIEILDRKNMVLGRASDVDITIEDITISKRHLKLLITDNGLQIQDLGSANGTILNGKRLTSMSMVPVPTESIVTIGRTCFSIHII